MLNFNAFHHIKNRINQFKQKHFGQHPQSQLHTFIKAPNLQQHSLNPNRKTVGARQIGTNKLHVQRHIGVSKGINR